MPMPPGEQGFHVLKGEAQLSHNISLMQHIAFCVHTGSPRNVAMLAVAASHDIGLMRNIAESSGFWPMQLRWQARDGPGSGCCVWRVERPIKLISHSSQGSRVVLPRTPDRQDHPLRNG